MGDTITWIAADGTAVTRTVTARSTNAGHYYASSDRFIIYRLDSDLPETIAKYPLLADSAHDFVGDAVVTSDQQRKGLVSTIAFWGESYGIETDDTDLPRWIYYEGHVSGDSASPIFVVHGTQMIYAGSVAGPADGPIVRHRIDEVLAACAALTNAHAPVVWGRDNTRVPRTMTLRRSFR